MKRLIIFDCDGTLVDSEYIASKVFPSVWAKMGVELSTDYFLCNFVGVANDSEVIKNIMAKLPPNAMAIADKKFEEELAENLEATAGIHDLLDEVKQQICVASNSSLPYLKRVLLKTKLSPYFADRVYSAHQVANPKPAPDLLLHAASSLGFAPDQCLVVEDSLAGVMAAKSAGMRVIGYSGGLHFSSQALRDRLISAKADYYCTNVKELKDLVLNFT